MEEILKKVWDGAGDTWEWLRGVLFGEWEDHQSTSQIVTSAIAGFTPGFGSIVTLRDLLAVIFRLAKYPEKRKEISEWILLIAMLLPLVLTVVGVAAAGIGALVGAEVGGFFRAIALFLVKEGGVAMKVLIDFLAGHGYGNALVALKAVKFAQFEKQVVEQFGKQVDRLLILLQKLEARLHSLHPESLPHWLPGRDSVVYALNKISEWTHALNSLRKEALNMIPKALIEMDRRLGAILAGDVKAATHTTHVVTTATKAPAVPKLAAGHAAAHAEATTVDRGAGHAAGSATHAAAPPATHAPVASSAPTDPMLKSPEPPEPGNTRRMPERRTLALAGKREYGIVDETGRPVGAKPYKAGDTLDHPPISNIEWKVDHSFEVKNGYPDLAAGNREEYANFSSLRPASAPAGIKDSFERVVDLKKPEMDTGCYYNRELPADGEDLRGGSAVKESWNNNGEHLKLFVPPAGDPIWKDLHALQEKAAGGPVPYSEELKYWEGPAASQPYIIDAGTPLARPDDWVLSGGKPQQYFAYDQLKLLKERGFLTQREPTGFADFNGTGITPRYGPYLEVIPLAKATPSPR